MLRSLLLEGEPTDVPVFVSLTLTTLVVALAAIVVPAFRATRVDPLIALTSE